LLGPASNLDSHLAEGVGFVIALDALEWRPGGAAGAAAGAVPAGEGWEQSGVEQCFGFGIIGAMFEGGAKFAGRAGTIARLGQRD